MTSALALLLVGQVVVTNVRPTTMQWPLDLSVKCALTGAKASPRTVAVHLHGAIGSGVSVSVEAEPDKRVEVVGGRVTAMLNGADDHTQNQMFDEFVVRADDRDFLATLSITYPPEIARPGSFDNKIAIMSAELALNDVKSYRIVTVGGEQLHVAKGKIPPVYLHGPCVLSPAPDGAAQ